MRARRAGFSRGPTDPSRCCAFFGATVVARGSRDDLCGPTTSRSGPLKHKRSFSQSAILLSIHLAKSSTLFSKGEMKMLPHTTELTRKRLMIASLVIATGIGLAAVYAHPASHARYVKSLGRIALNLNHWSRSGPEGGQIRCLALDQHDPGIIYAVGSSGIFKSTNAGESWSQMLANGELEFVAIAASTPTTVYAAGRGVYKSTDGGSSWSPMNNGIQELYLPIWLSALAIDPTNAHVVYIAGKDLSPGLGGYQAIYKSTDGGVSWSITKHSSDPNAVHHVLAVDPTNPNVIYAAGGIGASGTAWKSVDGGRSWDIYYLGYDSSYIVRDLAFDPHDMNTLYAANGRGVFKSIDAGVNWSVVNDQLPFAANSVKVDENSPNTLYASTQYGGIFKSMNGGSWNAINDGLSSINVNTLALSYQETTVLYSGTDAGVFKTTSSGDLWKGNNTGLYSVNIYPLTLDPANSANVYAEASYQGEDLGITYKSSDHGGSWTGSDFYPLAFDPHSSNVIYAYLANRQGLFKTTDGGATWTTANSGLDDNQINTIVIDPTNADAVYAGTYGGLFKSTDAGMTWNQIGSLLCPTILIIAPDNPQTLYSASGYDCYDYCTTVFKSTDGGLNWNRSDNGASFSYLASIAIDPHDANTLYATDGTIYKSNDAGKSWNKIEAGQVYGSDAIAVDPVHGNVVYAAGNGVFRSIDGGASWQPFSDGLTDPIVNALVIDPAGKFLHAGTASGVFDLQLAESKPNLIDDTQFFVRQHYRDFLNRDPDPDGLNFWTGQIFACGADPQCIEFQRINDSGSFFLSIE